MEDKKDNLELKYAHQKGIVIKSLVIFIKSMI